MSEAGLLARIDGALVRMFEAGPTAASRRRERVARVAACAVVSLTGVALLVPNLFPALVGGQPSVGLVLVGVGTLVCVGLVAAGALLYRSDFSTPNAVRIAVWNFLGLVVLGLVLLAHGTYRGAVDGATAADVLAAGNVLVISAAAHVIIGVHDARRVRAEQLAREREKLAVLSRVLRHNLRNDATVLLGHAERLADEVTEADLVVSAEAVRERSDRIGDLADKSKMMVAALDRHAEQNVRVNVAEMVERAVERVRSDADGVDVDVEVDVPADLWIWADHGVDTAVVELVENAVEHGGTTVRVTATADDEQVRVRVEDDGPGVPEAERAVVSGETEITQLTHGSGLGLWVARSVAEAAGGRLTFDTDEADDRTVVSLVHLRATPPADASVVDPPAAGESERAEASASAA
jgi:two-component system OmpR family sensor kinase